MTRQEIFMKVKETIKQVIRGVDISCITMDTHLRDDLGADSVDSMSLLIALEEQFDASIPNEEATGIAYVKEIVDAIEEALKPVSAQEAVCP